MAYPNRRGQFEHGVGGGRCSIDNIDFGRGGAGGWLTDDLAGFINGDAGWVPYQHDVRTGKDTPLFTIPCNDMYCGGGHWSSWYGSNDDNRGIHSSTGLRVPDGGLMGMGPDGAICYRPLYQSAGPTVVRELSGETWQLSVGTVTAKFAIQMLGQKRAIWLDTITGLSVVGLPKPVVVPGNIWRPRACFLDGQWWISYFHEQLGVVLHPFSSTVGWVITPNTQDAWQDIVAMVDTIRVGWSIREGEQPGELRRIEIDPVQWLRIDLDTGAVTPAPPAELKTPVHATPINKTIYQGWYVGQSNAAALGRPDWQTETDWMALPGNCRIDIPDALWKDRSNRLIALYVEGSPDTSIDAIERAVAKAKAANPNTFVLAYWPRQAWERSPVGADYVGVEAYMGVTESDAAFEARIRGALAKVPTGKRVIIPQCYSSNTGNTPDLVKVAAIVSKIAADVDIFGMVAFSGTGRKTGLWQHPEAVPIWTDIAASVTYPTQPPKPPDPPDPPKPVIPYRTHRRTAMTLDNKTVVLRGPGGMLGRPDAPNTGPWGGNGDGWRGIIFDGSDKNDARYHHVAHAVENKNYQFVHKQNNGMAGADASHRDAVAQQFYYMPDGNTNRGGYETWRVYDGNENGALSAWIEYNDEKGKYFSAPLAVEVVA